MSGKRVDKRNWHWFVRFIAGCFIRVVFRRKPRRTSLSLDTPFILLSNHQTSFDAGIMIADIDEYFVPVASEHVLHIPFLGKLVKLLIDPIIVMKGGIKVRGVSGILKTLRRGTSVMMHPEGTRTYDGTTFSIGEETGKLVKHSGAALVTFRMQGGYLAMPRWADYRRKGPVTGDIAGIYSAQEIGKMSVSEITDIIRRDLYQDDYAMQESRRIRYRGRNRAEGIENLIFICPSCRSTGTFHGEGNYGVCSCGARMYCDEYGYFSGVSVRDMNADMTGYFRKTYSRDIEFSDDDAVIQIINDDYTRETLYRGRINGYYDRITAGENVFMFSDFNDSPDLMDNGTKGCISAGSMHFVITGNRINLYKYVLLYEEFKKNFR